ncbi:HET-domain-containing protein [Polyplosphaeria fusca]|uniref:HET-domain-containing protein n=1 Tax=Polyplosphaeria fusca TaxID=682080 RepID=A0A9P4QSI9_9PLEO|nr:HET-domain-containing protein [Polyplosphaeria fusca]
MNESARASLPYAILSHTWEAEEYLYEDVRNGTGKDKRGYHKVKKFCELARSNEYRYGWLDTCCIDKSSSAELSEAINSMFNWYQQSAICYVYLDIDCRPNTLPDEWQLMRARWISRGWTLQELIAPGRVAFYTRSWVPCGDRQTLSLPLSKSTGISLDVLDRTSVQPLMLSSYSIANRMSWAAKRETTRPEDIAYCLLGLFDIHLPLLYGEGQAKAFRRLQEEIIRHSMDLSFLAWGDWDKHRQLPSKRH